MTDFVLPAPSVVAVPVAGSTARFPVRRVFCVGRNYAAHVAEMGGDLRDPPFYFTKPADAVVIAPPSGSATMAYPPATKDLHHEMELVIAIGTGGANIPQADALKHVWGYAAGLDMTRRDLQGEAKKKGQPWDMGKGFDQSAPIGPIKPAAECGDVADVAIELKVNGATRQASRTKLMIWSLPEIVSHLSGLVRLEPGDLIMTGTPEGVAACKPGDVLEGTIEGVGGVRVTIA